MNKSDKKKNIGKIMNFKQFFNYKTNNRGIQFYIKLALNNRLKPYYFQNKINSIKAEYEEYCKVLGIPCKMNF